MRRASVIVWASGSFFELVMTMMTSSSPYQQAALLELPLGRLYPMFGGQPYMFEQTRLFSVFSSIVLGRTSPELLQHEHRLDSRLAHPPMGKVLSHPKNHHWRWFFDHAHPAFPDQMRLMSR
uniref:Uncharacterized protein n=1 Tax=Coccidioides posadasii RMSCC 3488 TaxID=454284 RepID=A0A0J6FQN3_COCPO|nr:hypothetical protein CPAG_07631 [Coccidioides posadasii RMSCC 3488]